MVVFTEDLVTRKSPISSLVSTIGNSVQVKLDESNFLQWKFHMELVLEGEGILGLVDGSVSRPIQYGADMELTNAYKRWRQHDRALMSVITQTLSPSAVKCIMGSEDCAKLWRRLQERFVDTSRANVFWLKTELQTIKKGAETIDDYLMRIKDMRDQLSIAGEEYKDDDIAIIILSGLPEEYDLVKVFIGCKKKSGRREL